MWKNVALRKTASGLRTLVCVPEHGVESLNVGVLMHELDYVLELADSYNCALITRDELQDELARLLDPFCAQFRVLLLRTIRQRFENKDDEYRTKLSSLEFQVLIPN